ncbi:hypothetical protein FE257_001055 [Aspergillus nanangensis]|uniref:Uncharacterized protein n=1 Tax=Aspergillus nanangensis TaxID=2582783 RepID=A0AAD4CVP3_ASPNN|nr:hypothetical protein FE257_001055 [Aspergillus nanangensis]
MSDIDPEARKQVNNALIAAGSAGVGQIIDAAISSVKKRDSLEAEREAHGSKEHPDEEKTHEEKTVEEKADEEKPHTSVRLPCPPNVRKLLLNLGLVNNGSTPLRAHPIVSAI